MKIVMFIAAILLAALGFRAVLAQLSAGGPLDQWLALYFAFTALMGAALLTLILRRHGAQMIKHAGRIAKNAK